MLPRAYVLAFLLIREGLQKSDREIQSWDQLILDTLLREGLHLSYSR